MMPFNTGLKKNTKMHLQILLLACWAYLNFSKCKIRKHRKPSNIRFPIKQIQQIITRVGRCTIREETNLFPCCKINKC